MEIDNKTLDACILALGEQREIYRTPEFSWPNGCLNSVVTTSQNINALEKLRDNTPEITRGSGDVFKDLGLEQAPFTLNKLK
mgnify:CR=1 FL=1